MKRVLYASVIAMGCTIAVAAQGGMAAPASQDKMASKDAAKTVTATGCVAESGGKYMLNNATMGDMAGAPMTYAITGENFKPHVGHKIEVTGMMKPMSKDMKKGTMGKDSMAKDSSMPKDSSMAKDPMAKDDMAMGGTLTVKSMKMVAATCS